MHRAREILAYDYIDLIVPRPLLFGEEGVFPHFVQEAEGCRFTDSLGRCYIDWVNGWGPVLLGHRRREVEEAIKEQLSAGPLPSLMHPLEIEVASMLIEMVPCAEMAAFGKNGSDGLTAAARVARSVTGRDLILQYGMHGFHDWFTCVAPDVRGIPGFNRELIRSFPYNDLKALAGLFEAHAGQVAAVVMEPVREVLPEPGYLEAVRDLTHRHGALLIYDEVITAFRLANGGAQEYYGVIPDLACLGKGMANGMPISAVVGRRECMQHLAGVNFDMTFRNETLSLAAARAVLKILQQEPVAEHLARTGEAIRKGFERACAAAGVKGMLEGPPARMTFRFLRAGGLEGHALQTLFIRECMKGGVFINNNILPSHAHDDEAIEQTVRVFESALRAVAASIEAGHPLEGGPAGEAPHTLTALVIKGFIDGIHREQEGIRLSGWMLLDDAPADSVEFATPSGAVIPAEPHERADLATAFPHVRGAEKAGYTGFLPGEAISAGNGYAFTLCARRNDRVIFRCPVLCPEREPAVPRATGPFWVGDGFVQIE
jgi:glutamate-1-semialdehyde aminotransferase